MSIWQKWVVQNPLFRYHLLRQARWLLRRPIYQSVLFVSPIVALYIWLLRETMQNNLYAIVLGIECFALWLLASLMTHSLFASEFEKATWDMLVITRLSASQIVMGKFLSQLAVLGILWLFFLPLLALSLLQDHSLWVTLRELGKSQWLVLSWAVLLVAVTLWLSFRLRQSMTTVAVTFAGQAFVLFILPVFWVVFVELFFGAEASRELEDFGGWVTYGWMVDLRRLPLVYNPIVALVGLFVLMEDPRAPDPLLWGIWQGIIYLALAGWCAFVLTRSVAKSARKRV